MKFLITGSRGWTNAKVISKALFRIATELRNDSCAQSKGQAWCDEVTVVHGGAHGADELADVEAVALGAKVKVYKPNWDLYGRRAGILRNEQMLHEERPDVVLAFWDGTSRGTKHMIDTAIREGYHTVIYNRLLQRREAFNIPKTCPSCLLSDPDCA